MDSLVPRAFSTAAVLLWSGLVGVRATAATVEDQPPPNGCEPVERRAEERANERVNSAFPPLQLELRTPVEPIAFPSAGRTYLIYELHLRNFSRDRLNIRRIDVTDASSAARPPIATFEGARLAALWQPAAGASASGDTGGGKELAANEGAVAFLCLAFGADSAVPAKLSHRAYTSDASGDGPSIDTQQGDLPVLGPPVTGSNWLASSAPSNDSHHRIGLLVFDGEAVLARRYAIDWLQIEDGKTFAGDELDNRSYHAYGEEVLAVGDGIVVTVIDGLPDNTPRTAAGFRTAVPMTAATVAGNFIALDLGGGQFASYSHLQAGSLRVKEGDRVRRGQVLARIGTSGDARAAHLHFQVTTTPSVFAGEGVPYVIDRYRVESPDGGWEARTEELPLNDMLVDFGPATRAGD